MKTVGLFEAKTRFSEICQDVLASRQGVLVTKRGQPFVRILPVEKSKGKKPRGILADLAAFEKKHGEPKVEGPDFPDVWLQRTRKTESPMELEISSC